MWTTRRLPRTFVTGMKIFAFGHTDVGLQREHNEDNLSVLPEYSLYLVADGMGGHKAGDVASRMAVQAVTAFFQATSQEDTTWPFHFDPHLSVDENRLVTGIKVANKKIFEASTRSHDVHGMGTTIVGLLVNPERKKFYFAHVGDSRGYRFRGGKLEQLTRDHSLLNDYLLVMPDMPKEQRDELPKNVITRALGMQDTVVVDLLPDDIEDGDVFLLCSDGLSGMVSDEEICEILVEAKGDLEVAAKTLVDRANKHGGEDNITVVLVGASE